MASPHGMEVFHRLETGADIPFIGLIKATTLASNLFISQLVSFLDSQGILKSPEVGSSQSKSCQKLIECYLRLGSSIVRVNFNYWVKEGFTN